jgi:hypothetical protein
MVPLSAPIPEETPDARDTREARRVNQNVYGADANKGGLEDLCQARPGSWALEPVREHQLCRLLLPLSSAGTSSSDSFLQRHQRWRTGWQGSGQTTRQLKGTFVNEQITEVYRPSARDTRPGAVEHSHLRDSEELAVAAIRPHDELNWECGPGIRIGEAPSMG